MQKKHKIENNDNKMQNKTSYEAEDIDIFKLSCNTESISVVELEEIVERYNVSELVKIQYMPIREQNTLERCTRVVEITVEEYDTRNCYYLTNIDL